jgi:hypothetical protein
MEAETRIIEHNTQLTKAMRRESSSLPENTSGTSEGGIFSVRMSKKDFVRLSEFIGASCGIKLPPAKKTMLEGRLRKRLRALGIESFERYCEFLFSPGGPQSEYIHMIDAVTTNKTDFFGSPITLITFSKGSSRSWFLYTGLGKSSMCGAPHVQQERSPTRLQWF